MIPGRPLTRRTSLSEASIASEPELRNITESSGAGNVSASASARREIGSVKPIAEIGPISLSTWAWIAAVTRGWVCPSAVTAIPFAKSR